MQFPPSVPIPYLGQAAPPTISRSTGGIDGGIIESPQTASKLSRSGKPFGSVYRLGKQVGPVLRTIAHYWL